MTIKLDCPCGQRFAFDIEPVENRMPQAVGCPSCGVDATPAANEFIARQAPAAAVSPPAPRTGLRVSGASHGTPSPPPSPPPAPVAAAPEPSSTAPRRQVGLRPGQLDRESAEREARAKISWGDAPEDVVKFLMVNAFEYGEAKALVDAMFTERASTIRKNGIKKIVTGSLLAALPVVTFGICFATGVFLTKLIGATVLAGLYGLWQLAKGIFMVVAPKSEAGDVAEQ